MKRISIIKIKAKKYGRLSIINEAVSYKDTNRRWRIFVCKCDCGKIIRVKLSYLRNGDTKSCGCLKKDILVERSTKHGMTPFGKPQPLEYRIWASMIQRCENSKDKSYKYYGERGIKVSKSWHDFRNFFRDMGKKPTKTHSIDRINNDGNYSKENCRWATKRQQARNSRPRRAKELSPAYSTAT